MNLELRQLALADLVQFRDPLIQPSSDDQELLILLIDRSLALEPDRLSPVDLSSNPKFAVSHARSIDQVQC